jgi:hypothetical protein
VLLDGVEVATPRVEEGPHESQPRSGRPARACQPSATGRLSRAGRGGRVSGDHADRDRVLAARAPQGPHPLGPRGKGGRDSGPELQSRHAVSVRRSHGPGAADVRQRRGAPWLRCPFSTCPRALGRPRLSVRVHDDPGRGLRRAPGSDGRRQDHYAAPDRGARDARMRATCASAGCRSSSTRPRSATWPWYSSSIRSTRT